MAKISSYYKLRLYVIFVLIGKPLSVLDIGHLFFHTTAKPCTIIVIILRFRWSWNSKEIPYLRILRGIMSESFVSFRIRSYCSGSHIMMAAMLVFFLLTTWVVIKGTSSFHSTNELGSLKCDIKRTYTDLSFNCSYYYNAIYSDM